MDTDFLFFADVSESSLYLKDITEYPVIINEEELERDAFGIAFAYSFNDWETIQMDLSDFRDMTPISASTESIMRTKIFIVKSYDGNSYDAGRVCFYQDKFYVSDVDGNGNIPTDAGWTELTEEDSYSIFVNAFDNLNSLYASLDLLSEVPFIPYFTLKRTDVTRYEISNNYPSVITDVSFVVYDYKGQVIDDVLSENVVDLSEDGVYKVVISYTKDTFQETAVLIIDNFYAFETCARKIMMAIACDGDDCLEDAITRDKINEFSNVYFAIYMNLNVEKLKFYGLVEDDAELADYIQEVGLLVKKASLLVEQCKTCTDD